MPAGSLKKIWILAVVSAGVAGGLLYEANIRQKESLRGNAMFAASETLEDMNKVEIIMPNRTINVYLDEKLWRVPEADNYYADVNLMHTFKEAVSKAKFGNEVSSDKQEGQWTTIRLYDKADKILGEVEIKNASEVGAHYVRKPEKDKIYLSNWKINLPDTVNSWTQQPLIDFEGVNVKKLEKNGVTLSRKEEGRPFIDSRTKKLYRQFQSIKIFENLSGLWYDKVLSSQEFDDSLYPYRQSLKWTTFDGLVTELFMYSDYKEYWVKVEISDTRLPTVVVRNYIDNNIFRYKDWWFKLPNDVGKFLFMVNL